MKAFLKKHIVEIILYLVLFSGLCLLLYPTVSDWWNSFHQSRAISNYAETVELISPEEREAAIEAARQYNARVASGEQTFLLSDEELEEYNSLLNLTGDGIIGYLRIPVIDVNLPIYHTVSEEVLQIGVGHIPGSSLPVGGAGTHCLLSAHRGLPSSRLFTDLNLMQEGDIFTVTVLEQTVTYQVDQVRIVLPEAVDNIAVEEGRDYCTLVTCTPYGVNTHRILVRGHRVENLSDASIKTGEARRVPSRYVIPALAAPLLLLTSIGMVVFGRIKNRDAGGGKRAKKTKNGCRENALNDVGRREADEDREK